MTKPVITINRLPELVRYILMFPELSDRQIAGALGGSPETARTYRRKLYALGKQWSDFLGPDGAPPTGNQIDFELNKRQHRTRKARPDWAALKKEMNNPRATRQQVWARYRAKEPDGLAYSSFCAAVNAEPNPAKATMLQDPAPGDFMEIDYIGDVLTYQDPESGDTIKCQVLVVVLPASDLTFACCTATQASADFLDGCSRAVLFFGGCPRAAIPDNLKSAVLKPGADPTIQRHFEEWTRHHNMAALPARIRHPKDKPSVERAVRILEELTRDAFAHLTFHSLEEVNAAVQALLPRINDMPRSDGTGTRRSVFELKERDLLQPLPLKPYVVAIWRAAMKVPDSYYVSVDGSEYSVPWKLIGEHVEPCVSAHHVEFHHKGKCVARHARATMPNSRKAAFEHLTPAHRAYAQMHKPEHFRAWAEGCGPATAAMVKRFNRGTNDFQGLNQARALRNQCKGLTPERIEQVCVKATDMKMPHPTGFRQALRMILDDEASVRIAAGVAEQRQGKATPEASLNAHARRRAAAEAARQRREEKQP